MTQVLTNTTMILTTIIRSVFGLLFLASGASKLLRARSVERIIAAYRLLPRSLLPIARRLLGPAEIAAGALLLASLWLPIYLLGWILAFGLLLGFSIGQAAVLARGLEIACGCGLLLNGHVVTRVTLARNLGLLSLLILDLLGRRSFLL